jgi:magnesium transporter
VLGHLLLPEIQEMVRQGDFGGLRDVLSDLQPADIADLIIDLPTSDRAVIFRILPRPIAADAFSHVSHEEQELLVKALGDEQTAELLNAMPPDDRTAFLEELPGEVTRSMLNLLSPEELRVAKQLLGYPEESIGRLMTPDYISIREEWDVNRVLDHVRRYGHTSETLDTLYVTDRHGELVSVVRVRDILLAEPDESVSELMDIEVVSLKATDDQETAVQVFKKYDVVALPVTDTSGVLLGIITVDDVLDVAEQEATEDIQKLGGMEALEEPYMRIGYRDMLRKRAPWLVLLFIAEMGATSAMARYDNEISGVPALAFFVPLIMSCGGNSGSQAGTLVIRAMALGEVKIDDWWRVLRKEIFTSLTFGLILGVIGFFMVLTWNLISSGNRFGEHGVRLGATLGLSVLGVVMWGTLVGGMLPFILKRMNLDPATSSAPFVSTLIDVTGLVIFFNVALLLLSGVLL